VEHYSLKYERDGNIREYFDAVVAESEILLATPDRVEVVVRGCRAVWEGLQRLDALPRNHLFWSRTNNRATLLKLSDYCTLLLKEDPEDEQAIWTSIGLCLLWWINPLRTASGRQLFRSLQEMGKLRAEWLVQIGWWAEKGGFESTGYLKPLGAKNTETYLIPFLKELGLCAEARAELEILLQTEKGEVRKWATLVLDACGYAASVSTYRDG